ncbi:MAG: tRNA (N(6)-L-threonylcarbamoyladenosine(37)-C(2))-methylthiotransferase MtaB, partial [Rhodospirillaceae bacterium]
MPPTEPGGIQVVTFGCRLNTYESEVMRNRASEAGLQDAILVNTCAVTKEAERQARQAVRRLRRDNPHSRLIVTGCGAQLDPERWAAMPEVDRVLGNEEKLQAESYRTPELAGAAPNTVPAEPGTGTETVVAVSDIMAVTETAGHLITGFEERTRAFLQVQQGCDHRCTFCIIPFARGNNRSVPMGAVADHAKALVASGYRELVLTGVDITAYGEDLPGRPSLGQMVRRLLRAVPGLERLRLSSLDPVEVDDDLLRLLKDDPRLLPHVHLSVQAGDDLILKRMKRRHSRADVIALCDTLRDARPDIALGADIIVGFPTETEEMFQRSLDLVERCGLTHLHVFPYSPRPGTPAAKMPQLDKATIKMRAARLRAKGAEVRAAFTTARIGQTDRLLVERLKPLPDGRQAALGHGDCFLPLTLPLDPTQPEPEIGSI